MRIVSLLPGATELVCALGLKDQIVGVSHECDYPAGIEHLPRLTRSRLSQQSGSSSIDQQVRELVGQQQALFDLDVDLLCDLEPDLVVSQSLCDVCAVSDQQVTAAIARMKRQPQVVRLGPSVIEDVLQDMLRVGQVAGCTDRATQAVEGLRSRITRVRERSLSAVTGTTRPDVVLLEWIEPLFCAGHWNPELIELAGGRSVLGTAGEKSRQVAWEEILAADPDFLIVACCGLSIDRTLEDLPRLVSYQSFGRLKCISRGQVFLVDGSQYFNRPGPRLVDSLEILAHAIDGQLHPLPAHLEAAVRMKRAVE